MRRVGARVLIVQDKATVRYIGPVSGQEGTWVGVEWDDPARGKHDGSTGGVRYFETRSGPTAGSFIRIEKVDFGLSVEEALTLRYTNARGELGDVSREEMYVLTARQRRVEINVVGEEKIMALQSMTDKLVSARLVEAHVSHAVSLLATALSCPILACIWHEWTCRTVAGLPHSLGEGSGQPDRPGFDWQPDCRLGLCAATDKCTARPAGTCPLSLASIMRTPVVMLMLAGVRHGTS